MRIGFFSDPFSPPHVGQTVAAAAFMEQMWLDTLYVVPTLKDESAVPYADRLALCRRAFEGREGIVVSDLALRYPMLAGNVGVARHLSDLFGGDSRIFCLLGTDTLLSSETATCAGALFSACYPCYYRNDTDTALDDKIVQKIAEYYEKFHKNFDFATKLFKYISELNKTDDYSKLDIPPDLNDSELIIKE